jgi:hypothetical protein
LLQASDLYRLTGTASTGPSLDFEPDDIKNMSCAIAIGLDGKEADHDDKFSRSIPSSGLLLGFVADILCD